MTNSYTPMIVQYRDVKANHPDEILFFRLGDFYEMFFEDAQLASRELEITLTSREGGKGIRVPMCGIPYHAAENYIGRLIEKGYRIAICEQVEDPRETKGIVRREVVRVVTPGTVMTENALPGTANNYLFLCVEENSSIAMAIVDVSTGEFIWNRVSGTDRYILLFDYLSRFSPTEIVITGKLEQWEQFNNFVANRLNRCVITVFSKIDPVSTSNLPGKHFSASGTLPQDMLVLQAIGSLLYYLHDIAKTDLSHINRLTEFRYQDHLAIDATTLRNLEITRNIRDGGKKGTLYSVIDFTKTAMGSRLLKRWLEAPLVNILEIDRRLDAVEELAGQSSARFEIRKSLDAVYDLERILTRIEVGAANARDLISLKTSLSSIPAIKTRMHDMKSSLLSDSYLRLLTHQNCVELIQASINDEPPFSIREGGFIKEGYDIELDELRHISRDSRLWIQDLENREREATGIKSLKISYNKVFGYYIEVTHANSNSVPAYFARKQTLVNAERYITPELKEFETKILGAQEKIAQLEYQIFSTVREYLRSHLPAIQESARIIAKIDCLASFAEAANLNRYVRPVMLSDRQICIKEGRHPVIERILTTEMFVPNDAVLNHDDSEIIILTGPNMAGKSTYMRQIALLVLMSQAGSFIPAKEARISPVDRIFSRVGASDDLATGQSTFMVEMTEVSNILYHATKNSLIILDEIGRGTSTFDGMSIARAVLEYIKERIHAKTIFATHYHELTSLSNWSSGIQNFSVAVKERGNEVIFLRRITPGGADKSYGIHVAQLAGLPKRVVERSQQLLDEMEITKNDDSKPTSFPEKRSRSESIPLFNSEIAKDLLALDVMTLSPIEALNILYKLHNQAKQEAGQN